MCEGGGGGGGMKWKLPYTSVGEVTVMLFPLAYRRVEGVGRGICFGLWTQRDKELKFVRYVCSGK